MEYPQRILHIVSAMGRGGAETLIMNIYRKIDHSKVQFDFITHGEMHGDYENEILLLGGRIYNIPSLGVSGPIQYLRNLIKIMSREKFIAVHAHTDFQSGFPALAAKICKIKYRICHSHSSNWLKSNYFKEKVTLKILQSMIKLSATHLCSCSEEATEFLFGRKRNVIFLKNAIDLEKYEDLDWRKSRISAIRELQLEEDTKIIGHVGRFSESKNHMFMLKLLKSLISEDTRYKLLFIGDGPLKKEIENEATKQGLQENIRFLGVRSDIPRLMKAFDLFLFPSLFEGFGIVMLEAQSAGTPCIAATTVPASTDMGLGLVKYVDLEDPIDKWCTEIKAALSWERPDQHTIFNKITNQGFNIQENVSDWLKLYGIYDQQSNSEVVHNEEKNLNFFL
ncbi:glycosyltransferase family 1 protein [Bacillus niameyensis]|uniref:glycosyltransferase family 1 protein n=1 Tax=Bacillus niameyensis TaxID=1522308 RepID=UPI000AF67FCF|nr:glycosyltransferase family 1 protein [Bacillus niameyensis]